jgi:hypothetical protein
MKIINKILIIKFQKDQDFQNQLKMMTILLIRWLILIYKLKKKHQIIN